MLDATSFFYRFQKRLVGAYGGVVRQVAGVAVGLVRDRHESPNEAVGDGRKVRLYLAPLVPAHALPDATELVVDVRPGPPK